MTTKGPHVSEDTVVIDLAADEPTIDLAVDGLLVDTETVEPPRLDTFYARHGKRIVDVVLGSLLLVLLSPVMLATAVLVLVTMGRPVLFLQDRVGLDGRHFRIYKFRSMRPDRRRRAEAPPEERRRSHKALDTPDPRITRLGDFIRRTSIDELPQFLNVVRGDMSLVGPRPELTSVVATYEEWQHARHVVRPGVTGLWQVTARAQGPAHENVQLDIEYLDRVRLADDLQILAVTPLRMFAGQQGH